MWYVIEYSKEGYRFEFGPFVTYKNAIALAFDCQIPNSDEYLRMVVIEYRKEETNK